MEAPKKQSQLLFEEFRMLSSEFPIACGPEKGPATEGFIFTCQLACLHPGMPQPQI